MNESKGIASVIGFDRHEHRAHVVFQRDLRRMAKRGGSIDCDDRALSERTDFHGSLLNGAWRHLKQ